MSPFATCFCNIVFKSYSFGYKIKFINFNCFSLYKFITHQLLTPFMRSNIEFSSFQYGK